MNNVSVIGLGYVGLPLAISAAEHGYKVIGIDKNNDLIQNLLNSYELNSDFNFLKSKLEQSLKLKNFFPTSSYEYISKSEIVIVCLPTPLDKNGLPDLSILTGALLDASKYIQPGTLLIVESTVFPGTMDDVVMPMFKDKGIRFGYSPERIDPNNKTFRLENTPKIISASDQDALVEVEKFYSKFIPTLHKVAEMKTAEFAKVIENTYRLVNISLVNELLKIGNGLNLDVRKALEAAATKPFGFELFSPGAGAGGHCIPVDPVYLLEKARSKNIKDVNLLSAAVEVNNSMPSYVVETCEKLLVNEKSRILIYGISYKSGVADTRESASLAIRDILINRGHDVFWYDELIKMWNNETRVEKLTDFDLVLVVNFSDLQTLKDLANKNTKILDCTGSLERAQNVFHL